MVRAKPVIRFVCRMTAAVREDRAESRTLEGIKQATCKYHTTVPLAPLLLLDPFLRPSSLARSLLLSPSRVNMKGCLVLNGASPRSSPRPPARKCVSFCGSGSNSSSSSDDEQEIVEVHVADDWDRTPCEITPKLTHKDLLELYELKSSVTYPQGRPNFPRPTQLLNRVPVGLLPLLPEAPSSPPKSPSKPGLKNTSSVGGTFPPRQPPFLRETHFPAPASKPPNSALASRFKFLPLMPVDDDESTGGEMAQSPINPQSPATVPNRFQKKFTFVPLLESSSSSEPPSDDDHPSPTSTPSLTASSLPSPPPTPSATSSPSLTSSPMAPHLCTADADYFNLSRPLAGTNQKPDRLATEMDQSFSKLTLQAFPSPGLVPPSPFELDGGHNDRGKEKEQLGNSGRLGRKGGKRCVVEYININGVDEPFYSYVDDDEPPSPLETSDSTADLLRPSKEFLPLYE